MAPIIPLPVSNPYISLKFISHLENLPWFWECDGSNSSMLVSQGPCTLVPFPGALPTPSEQALGSPAGERVYTEELRCLAYSLL